MAGYTPAIPWYNFYNIGYNIMADSPRAAAGRAARGAGGAVFTSS